ncbi:hypothetical protein [Rhizobium leguminosarum]|uniref:hypothetical protein n=1 Tax=Rhizobium leguminosarum TaxID=384 RepID=UPI001031BEE4|nr:hypothetical protein [Rhizobium leguminosarum]TBF40440.1 hypothetical protein ELG92_10385 [Rhizobium leguminosarum]
MAAWNALQDGLGPPEDFGMETPDDLLHEVSVIIDDGEENQIKTEQFVQDYPGDGYEVRLRDSRSAELMKNSLGGVGLGDRSRRP